MEEGKRLVGLYRAVLMQLKKDLLRKPVNIEDQKIISSGIRYLDNKDFKEVCKYAEIDVEDFLVSLKVDLLIANRRE